MQQFAEFVLNHWDLFLALGVILALLAFQGFGERLRGFTSIDPREAVLKLNHDGALIVDVREEKEFHEGHIVNSTHIPLGELGRQLERLENHKGKPIIVACRSGSRSSRACGMLRKQGFDEVYNLRGGVMGWQSADLPVETGRKSKKR